MLHCIKCTGTNQILRIPPNPPQKSIVSKVKLATVVEDDQKAPFSIATTPKCRGGCYSFPWITPLYP